MTVQLKRKKTEHYVDNKKFLEEMKKYRKKVLSARNRNRKDPPISDYIGECFLKIANHLSYRPNFINYTYKEDMISDGKQKLILKSGLDEIVRQEGDNEEYQNSYADFLRKNMIIEQEPEKKEKPKLKRKKITKLEFFM